MTASIPIKVVTADWSPAAVDVDETEALFNVSQGDVVLAAFAQRLVGADESTNSTISLGDGGDAARIVAATGTEGTVGSIAQATANLPYVYPTDDTIDADYIDDTTPGATIPKFRFYLLLADALPA